MKLKKAKYRKGTTWFRTNRYVIDGYCKQIILNFGSRIVLIGVNPDTKYIRFGDNGCGLQITKQPSFSVRNGYKKSLKIGKYYINKIK